MKHVFGKVLKTLLILAIAGGLGYGGYTLYQNYHAESKVSAGTSYTSVSVTTGSLTQSVISTGVLSISDTRTVTAPVDITIERVNVQAGETVAAGDTLLTLDTDALDAAIKSLKLEIEIQDSTIVNLANKQTVTKTLTAPIAGRVKAVYITEGQYVQETLETGSSLMLLSLDGLMKAKIAVPDYMTVNTSVKVLSGERTYTGTVSKIIDGMAIVTFPDTRINIGDTVQVTSGSAVIGSGTAEVNMPYLYSTTIDGYVSSITAVVNTSVSRNSSLMYVTNIETSDEYNEALKVRQELQKKLETARALLKNPSIYAETEGIVSAVSAFDGTEAPADTVLLTMYVGDAMKMVISVDELDIINVKAGQEASIVMDALPNTTYDAAVKYVSQIGTSSSGITNYSVTLAVTGDDNLKLGMNGTATIHIGEQNNVLLVPLAAVQSDKEGSYVWKYDTSYTATDEQPGLKTYITTGLSNEDYAAVTRGLSLGDSILVVRTAVSAISTDTDTANIMSTFGNMGEGTIPGGTMPEGFTPRTRTEGFGTMPGGN